MGRAEPVKTAKTGMRALGGEWRTADERGGVAERSGAPREEKGDPSSVDLKGCLIWPRLRLLKHGSSNCANEEPGYRGSLRQTCSNWERGEGCGAFQRSAAKVRAGSTAILAGGGTYLARNKRRKAETLRRVAISCLCFGEVECAYAPLEGEWSQRADVAVCSVSKNRPKSHPVTGSSRTHTTYQPTIQPR
ncbi:hypothetical protein BU25DRAFT_121679 [Macroventuria anomochaeta]|uniref:Uncharacterized protein n=1 Tax=Macroventuria anomochaeta TaxID=301207 RepID=A0ACB6RU30_9PLEO|nr:uncharacterized protein BU25DRAFT_121679 [Macroventuria anomochaeta]KAF2625411.1 hypothetical protein BU25DRAFT_121679 [Macroventuria anomochaeta]